MPPTESLRHPLVRGAGTEPWLGRNGFAPPRRCRDTGALVALLLCFVAMAAIAAVALREGDIGRLETGMDVTNQLCGLRREGYPQAIAERPFVFFACLPYGRREPTVCTAECPKVSGQYVRWYNGSLISCPTANGRSIPATTYPTTHLQQNCVPSAASLYALVATQIDTDAFPSTLEGILKARWLLAAAACAAALLAAGWGLAVRALAPSRRLALLALSLCVSSLLLLAAALWFRFLQGLSVAGEMPVLQGSLQVATNAQMAAALAAIATAMAVGVGVALSCGLLQRLLQAGGLLREASEAIASLPALLILPLLLSCAIALLAAVWLYVSLYIASAGKVDRGVLHADERLQWLFLLHSLGSLWAMEVLFHWAFCATAGLIVRWYFGASSLAAGGGRGALLRASCRTLRYSAGSLAIGSLLVLPGRPLRFLLEHCLHQAQTDGSGKPELRGVAHCCLRCCLDVATRHLQYMSHNAYVLVAVHDVGFREGARQAFELTLSNIGRVAVLAAGERLLLSLGKLSIASLGTAAVAAALSTPLTAFSAADNGSGVACFAFVLTYAIANAWLVLFDAAVEAIFLCFLVDQAENDGETRPFYASAALRSYMEAHRPTYVLPSVSLDDDELSHAIQQMGGLDALEPPPPMRTVAG